LEALLDDRYIKDAIKEQLKEGYWFGNTEKVKEMVDKHDRRQDVS
jgi:hypothetical protein